MSTPDDPEVTMTDDADDDDAPELPEAQVAEIKIRCGGKFYAASHGGHLFVFRKPKGPEYLKFKVEQASPVAVTAAEAGVTLARTCIVPADPKGSIKDEREAFDRILEDAPAVAFEILAPAVVGLAFGEAEFRQKKAGRSSPSR